jgi:hypothetical protein
LFSQRCTSVEHNTQSCKVKMVCDICGKNTHVTGALMVRCRHPVGNPKRKV